MQCARKIKREKQMSSYYIYEERKKDMEKIIYIILIYIYQYISSHKIAKAL